MTQPETKLSDMTSAAPAPAAQQPAHERKPRKLPETTEGLPWHSNHEIKKEPNAFTDRDWYNRTYAWAGMAVRFVIVFGSIFSVYQFLAARSEKRVERTLQLVEIWEAPDTSAAQVAINTKLGEINAANSAFFPKDGTEAEKAEYFSRIGRQAAQDPALRDQIDKMIYFLNRLAFCVDGNLCSPDVAEAYFRDYAISFWQYFAGYVAQRRQVSPNFAQPIETYVRSLKLQGSPG